MSKENPPQSDGISYGDSAQGNITITGGVGGDFVAGDKHVHEAPAPIVSALHQLPLPPADFTGREAEIAELLAALEDDSLTISGLQGMGGIGKTALALKLAEKIKERYPDGQFYLDLLGVSPQPLTPAQAMAHVIHAYHPDVDLPESEAESRGIYLSVLHNQRALLLMDNARDKKQVEPLIPPAGCKLIITSRQTFTLPGIFAKNLDCLPPTDACKLLLAIAPRIGELAGEIARLCGYLPFALRLAASIIAERRNVKPVDYMRQLADAQKRLELIESSLSLSYDILSEEQQLRWRMLSVFPDSFDEAVAAAVLETEDGKARDTLSELLAFSLVEWNETAGRYRLHDLARVFADSNMNEAERDGGRRLLAWHYQSSVLRYAQAAVIPLPIPVSPVLTAIRSTTPTLRWGAVPGAEEYMIRVVSTAKKENGGVVWEGRAGSQTQVTLPAGVLQQGEDYLWQVEAIVEDQSRLSPTVGFQVLNSQALRKVQTAERSYKNSALVLASVYEAHGLYEEALAQVERLAKTNPTNSKTQEMLGSLRRQLCKK